jgi:hypothetical protein
MKKQADKGLPHPCRGRLFDKYIFIRTPSRISLGDMPIIALQTL